MKTRPEPTRRQFLLGVFGWFPFFRHRREATLAGIRFNILRRGKSGTRYLLIHGNEDTARQVLTAHMRSHDGIAYLAAGHERNVPVRGGVIDPNRLFSREGARASLRNLNREWPEAQVERELDRLDRTRGKLVDALLPPPGGVLFAVHNNSEGYSVTDEVPISDSVSLRDPGHPHEFFLCTMPEDYGRLALSPYNVVFQQLRPTADDGSLSRLAARRGVRYVNLEVALGNAGRQKEMLEYAVAHLSG